MIQKKQIYFALQYNFPHVYDGISLKLNVISCSVSDKQAIQPAAYQRPWWAFRTQLAMQLWRSACGSHWRKFIFEFTFVVMAVINMAPVSASLPAAAVGMNFEIRVHCEWRWQLWGGDDPSWLSSFMVSRTLNTEPKGRYKITEYLVSRVEWQVSPTRLKIPSNYALMDKSKLSI